MEIVLHLLTIFLMVAGIVVNASRIRYFNMSNIRKTPFKSTVVVVLYLMLPLLIISTAAGLVITSSRYLYLVSTAESPVNVIFPVTLVLALTGLIVGLTWFDGWLQRTPTWRQMAPGRRIPHT